jgi:hypothetical protein
MVGPLRKPTGPRVVARRMRFRTVPRIAYARAFRER